MKITISQHQIVILERWLAHFSHQDMGFPHAFTCLFSCVHKTQLFAAQIRRKKFSNFFVFFLSKISFGPDTPGTWKRGKPAKTFVPWKFRPGVAPCSGHFEKLGRNWQRQKEAFWVVQMKKSFFCQKLFQNPTWTYLFTRNGVCNKTVLHIGCGNTTPSHWYFAKIGQKHQK